MLPNPPTTVDSPRNRLADAVLLTLMAALAFAIYFPGISGPYIFDDYTNIVHNSFLRIESLDLTSLYHAAFSLDSGPLRRPVAMLSFALNYYASGSMAASTPYKATNIAIHAANGMLVFAFLRMLFRRLEATRPGASPLAGGRLDGATLSAATIALLWIAHPIQLTSVLYVVQRMNSLAALFSLLALISYLKGRLLFAQAPRRAVAWMLGGGAGFGALALLSKETALLLPVFVLLLEVFLFPDRTPWAKWRELSARQKRLVLLVAVAALVVALIAAVRFALPGYASRPWTMSERLMTEARILFIYLSLIVAPQTDRFGHQHDDVPISLSLWEPWTTLPALAGHLILLAGAAWLFRRHVLVSLGVLWFYIGHGLESTFFALEIAHEHRNYFPSIGIIVALVAAFGALIRRVGRPRLLWLLGAYLLLMATATALRADQWSSPDFFYRYESLHKPDSPRVQAGLAILLEARRDYDGAAGALLKAAELEPQETGHYIQLQLLAARYGRTRPAEESEKIERMLRTGGLTATTFLSIQHITGCLQTSCARLQKPLENWLRIILGRKGHSGDRSFYEYALGITLASQNRVPEAIEAFERSHALDRHYVHPLFVLVSIHVQLRDLPRAEQTLQQLIEANKKTPYPQADALAAAIRDVERLKQDGARQIGDEAKSR